MQATFASERAATPTKPSETPAHRPGASEGNENWNRACRRVRVRQAGAERRLANCGAGAVRIEDAGSERIAVEYRRGSCTRLQDSSMRTATRDLA